MFTGIVQGIARVIAVEEKINFRVHVILLPPTLINGLQIGASVSHNGCCLTVTAIKGNEVSFNLVEETLRLTNLGVLKVGDEVNIERAATIDSEIGGHLMSGHIITMAEIVKIVNSENNYQVDLKLADTRLMKYVFHKGYIGIDGVSLTLGEVTNDSFCVHLIPETLRRTTLGKKCVGDMVNVEIDHQTQAIVETVERVLTQHGIVQNAELCDSSSYVK